jgi:hypothetical protein
LELNGNTNNDDIDKKKANKRQANKNQQDYERRLRSILEEDQRRQRSRPSHHHRRDSNDIISSSKNNIHHHSRRSRRTMDKNNNEGLPPAGRHHNHHRSRSRSNEAGGGNNRSSNNFGRPPSRRRSGDPPAHDNTSGSNNNNSAGAAVAAAAAAPPPDAEAASNQQHPPLLQQLLRHLREFCSDGGGGGNNSGGPSVSAIHVEKARNVLEASCGNVALAGQLYWDDYFASQAHHQHQDIDRNNVPVPPAAAAAAAADAPAEAPPANSNEELPVNEEMDEDDEEDDVVEEVERRIRRRLESDFERLLPPPPPEHRSSSSNRRRRRRRNLLQAVDAEGAAIAAAPYEQPEPALAAAAAANNILDNNIGRRRHNVEDVQMMDGEAADANAEPAQPVVAAAAAAAALADNNANNNNPEALFVAARAVAAIAARDRDPEASASVSDDEAGVAGVLRMVRERGRINHILRRSTNPQQGVGGKRRRRHPSRDIPESFVDKYIRARERFHAKFADAGGGGDDDDDDDSSSSDDSDSSDTGDNHNISKNDNEGCGDKTNNNDDEGDDDDAYLSDNDWLFSSPSQQNNRAHEASSGSLSSAASHTSLPLRAPFDFLWGGLVSPGETSVSTKIIKSNSKDNAADGDEDAMMEEPEDDNNSKKSKEGSKSGNENEDEENNNNNDDDAEGDDEDEDDEDNNDSTIANLPEIPTTWLHAAFLPSSDRIGLVVKEPKPEEMADHSWRLQQQHNPDAHHNHARRHNSLPLPYHCRSITAISSIVTGLLYTGASIQSDRVTCSSSRVPFLELSQEDRTREFESRLTDALSALILIAAQASAERKKKALAKKQAKKSRKKKRKKRKKNLLLDDRDPRETALQRRLKLCPMAWWQETAEGETRLPAEQLQRDMGADDASNTPIIQLTTSYSNIGDIRSYVLSNMRSFTAPGGIALFLETIVGIHGKGAVVTMLRKSRAALSKSNASEEDTAGESQQQQPPFLVCCTCEERQRKRLANPKLTQAARRKLMNTKDPTPPGHECISTELISLLLTGKVHSTFRGWSTGPLGFGILSNKAGEVGQALSRPPKPVWVLKGPTCYSLLVLDHTRNGGPSTFATDMKKNASPIKPKAAPCMKMAQCSDTSRIRDLQKATAFSQSDRPGFIANLMHWNCWYAQRNQSGLRLITDRPQWNPPSPSKVLANYKRSPEAEQSLSLTCEKKTIKQQLKDRRSQQQQQLADVVSADEREAADSLEMTAAGTEKALQACRAHPDDANFYPKQFRMWRFDMGEQDTAAEHDPNAKPRGDHWVPFHSLTRQEQMIVEMKLGPAINCILWTRWPRATIDKFTPEGKHEQPPFV